MNFHSVILSILHSYIRPRFENDSCKYILAHVHMHDVLML
jgi:hypothetical protein